MSNGERGEKGARERAAGESHSRSCEGDRKVQRRRRRRRVKPSAKNRLLKIHIAM